MKGELNSRQWALYNLLKNIAICLAVIFGIM